MRDIQNATHFVDLIKSQDVVIARKYKKIDIGLLWEKDYYLNPNTYEYAATWVLAGDYNEKENRRRVS